MTDTIYEVHFGFSKIIVVSFSDATDYSTKIRDAESKRGETARTELCIIRQDPKLWQSYYNLYAGYDFARKQHSYLQRFFFTADDMNLANTYFHLSQSELAKLIDLGLENSANFTEHLMGYHFNFQFHRHYQQRAMMDKLYALNIPHLQIATANLCISVSMFRQPPRLISSEISEFRTKLKSMCNTRNSATTTE